MGVIWVAGCAAQVEPAITPAPESEPTVISMPESDEALGRLDAARVDAAPDVDGEVEGAWDAAPPLWVGLAYGQDGAQRAPDMELRALRTDGWIYFLARWEGEPPAGGEDVVLNKITLHWQIPEPAARGLDCTVVCHTAHADGRGRFVYANSETIPQGGSEALSAGGGWNAGLWTLEWGRPLDSSNPYDLQFRNPDAGYIFRAKVFERVEGRADPVSGPFLLVLEP